MISKTRITCDICGWSWKKSEGGDDLYICHKCYHDNENPLPSWDKMRFRTFEQFNVNEDLKSLSEISKKWYDKPSKISKEILEIVDEVFPKKLMDAVTHIEPNMYDMMISPPTVSNKGQSTGEYSWEPIDRVKKLYTKEFEQYIDRIEHVAKQYGI